MSWSRVARRAIATSHYERLGVPLHASWSEVRSAFINLAKKVHPDVSANPNSEREFVALKQAFDVLYDPQQREQYTSQLSRRGTGNSSAEESHYQPHSSDDVSADRSRQRRTLRRGKKDLVTTGKESWEELEKELEEALDRAYHGPLGGQFFNSRRQAQSRFYTSCAVGLSWARSSGTQRLRGRTPSSCIRGHHPLP